jgi:hypothetical protein
MIGSGVGFVALRALAARPDLVAMACDSRAPLIGYGRDRRAGGGRVPAADRIRRLW